MAIEHFRVITFLVYLASWLAVAVGAVMGAIPGRKQRAGAGAGISPAVAAGTLLQVVAVLPITMALGDAPLRPGMGGMLAALALAPFGAAMYWWALRSAPSGSEGDQLVTGGAYRVLRHPMYLGFLALVMATGLLATATLRLGVAIALYLAGTELRVAAEEAELAERFPGEYAEYQRATRWRYLWGLR